MGFGRQHDAICGCDGAAKEKGVQLSFVPTADRRKIRQRSNLGKTHIYDDETSSLRRCVVRRAKVCRFSPISNCRNNLLKMVACTGQTDRTLVRQDLVS